MRRGSRRPCESEGPVTAPNLPTNARALARRDGPATSALGALHAASNISPLQAEALEAVRRWPDCTATELAQRRGDGDPRRINRRLGELRAMGAIVEGPARACNVTGRPALTWTISETN
jgi:hypothetical protein